LFASEANGGLAAAAAAAVVEVSTNTTTTTATDDKRTATTTAASTSNNDDTDDSGLGSSGGTVDPLRVGGVVAAAAMAASGDGGAGGDVGGVTDDSTLHKLVVSCLGAGGGGGSSGVPLLLKRSRVAVPLFLEFMALDFYGVYGDDVDRRELGLEGHLAELAQVELETQLEEGKAQLEIEGQREQQELPEGLLFSHWLDPTTNTRTGNSSSSSSTSTSSSTRLRRLCRGQKEGQDHQAQGGGRRRPLLRPAEAWTRLSSYLQVFSAAGSPKQLVKEDVLLQVFVRLLAKPKALVAQQAFECLKHWKLPYLRPYEEKVAALVSDSNQQVSLMIGWLIG
jgi:hypothetical protein